MWDLAGGLVPDLKETDSAWVMGAREILFGLLLHIQKTQPGLPGEQMAREAARLVAEADYDELVAIVAREHPPGATLLMGRGSKNHGQFSGSVGSSVEPRAQLRTHTRTLWMMLFLVDRWREWTLPRSHRRRIRAARRVLARIDGWEAARILGYLRKIDPLSFEELILESFARAGHRIKRGRRYSGDGGIDGHVWRDGRWVSIQCKRYSAHINPTHVRAFAALTAGQGFFVHTGRTGPASREGAAGIDIISGQKLIALIRGTNNDQQ
jgi:restriction system protein